MKEKKQSTVSLFFGEDENDKIVEECGPLYTTLNFPDELNPLWPTVRDMTEKEFEKYALKLRTFFLKKYEEEKFPVGSSDIEYDEIVNRLKKFNNLDINTPDVFYTEDNNKIIKGYNTWGTVIDHWFPEMMDVEITRGVAVVMPSIIGVFRDKELYMKRMKRMLWKDKLNGWRDNPNQPVWPTLKQSIRMGSGTQPVTNIRTPVAKWIYQTEMLKHLDKDVLVVYDPSMGWAGRLIGFLAATNHPELKRKKCIYIGTDPNSAIYERYNMIVKFWKLAIDKTCTAEVFPLCIGSEDFNTTNIFKKFKGKGILAYTSPPYFNRERYSSDETQSFRKFDNYSSWKEGFLDGTIRNVSEFLEEGSRFYWNTANIKIGSKFLPLEKDSILKAEKYNMKHIDTLKMLMRFTIGRDNNMETMKERGSMNIVKTEGKFVKFEPILVFQK